MRCSGSPTTCIAADPHAAETRAVRDVMSALLFREILNPLAQGLGPVGEIALGGVTDALFVRRPQ